MDLSIVIVSYQVKPFLLSCLESIRRHGPDGAYEVVCVDNGSTDGTPDALRERFPEVRTILNPSNRGWTRAGNQGLRAARGAFLLLLDPDTVLGPQAADRMLAFLRSHPRAGCVGPRTLFPDGTLQLTCRNFPGLAFALYHTVGVHKLFPGHPAVADYYLHTWDHRGNRRVDMVNTHCVMFRREVLASVGPFDEDFFAHYGDNDWFQRIRNTPWEVWFTGDAEIVHHASRSTRGVIYRQIVQQQRDLYRFFRKHHADDMPSVFHPVVAAGIGVRAGLLMAANLLRRRKSLYSHPRGWR